MEPLVSVIVPIYNVEKYLDRAVASIRGQSHERLEIILVEDGSPDGCGAMCDAYAKEDSRIQVIHQANGGLSAARNAGLDIAQGEYIVFVDSDDYVHPDFVRLLLEAALEHQADVAMCSYQTTERVGMEALEAQSGLEADPLATYRQASTPDLIEVCDRSLLLTNLYDANHPDATYFIVAWNKLYRACLFDHIRFPKGKIHEDEATTYRIYDACQKGVYVKMPLYFYYEAPQSITRGAFSLKRLQWFDALDERIAYLEEKYAENPTVLGTDTLPSQALIGQDTTETVLDIPATSADTTTVDYAAQIAYARRARADAAMRYYYPLKEIFPREKEQIARLKSYVRGMYKPSGAQTPRQAALPAASESQPQQDVTQAPASQHSGPIGKSTLGYRLFCASPSVYRILTCVGRDQKERLYQAAYLLLFGALAFLCCYHLGQKYVDAWDEARHGVNAYEMLKNGTLIRSTYLYATDYYNLKPPLSMWMLMASFLIFGKNILALRLPSVFCYLVTALASANFLGKKCGRGAALLCLALLAANTTPFLAHMVRSGDADSLFVLLFTLAMLHMMQLREDKRHLIWCGLCFALAFLTKSFHAGVIVAIGGVYLLLTREIFRIKRKEWLAFLAAILLPIAAWALARFATDGTSFLKQMWLTDVVGRDGADQDALLSSPWYYLRYYIGDLSGSLPIYRIALVLLLVGGCLYGATRLAQRRLHRDHHDRHAQAPSPTPAATDAMGLPASLDLPLGFTLWILIPFVAFSLATSKRLWYVYPALTALLIATAALIGYLVHDPRVKKCFAFTLWAVAFVVACLYGQKLFDTFATYGEDVDTISASQQLIETVGIAYGDRFEEIYIGFYEGDEVTTQWGQQCVYVAEVYGDFVCTAGGIHALLASLEEGERALIIVDAAYYEEVLRPAVKAAGHTCKILERAQAWDTAWYAVRVK